MIYEKLIYLLFNITMTSLPIVWYALFDEEHRRQDPQILNPNRKRKNNAQLMNEEEQQLVRAEQDLYLMTNPSFYRIGLKDECFSSELYLGWIVYALWHALVVYYSVYYALTELGVTQPDGKDIGLWLAGTTVYGSCVMVVNLTLLMKLHIHHSIGTFLFAGSVGSYFVFFWILSKYAKDDIAHLFYPTLSLTIVWLTLIFSVSQVFIFEYLLKSCKRVFSWKQNLRRRNLNLY